MRSPGNCPPKSRKLSRGPYVKDCADGERGSGRPSSARFRLFLASTDSGSLRIGQDIDPLQVRSGLGIVVVVPVPPLVRRSLWVTLWRVLPSLLAPKRCDVEVAPGGSHRLIAATVDEICAEHLVVVTEEHVVAVPFIDTEVLVEAVDHGVPRHVPAHPLLQPRDIRLRRARGP